MTDYEEPITPEDWFDFDIHREGRPWTSEEIERKYSAPENLDTPGRMELIDGKLFWRHGQRLTMLGWMLEMVGADAAVRLGDPEVWRAAIEALPIPVSESGDEEQQ